MVTFPSFGFLLAAPEGGAERAAEPFLRRGLACAQCGRLDDTGVLRLAAAGETAELWDLGSEPFTHLRGNQQSRPPRSPARGAGGST